MDADLNLNNSTSQFKAQVITMERCRIIALTKAVLEDPNNVFYKALLNKTIARLEMLLTA